MCATICDHGHSDCPSCLLSSVMEGSFGRDAGRMPAEWRTVRATAVCKFRGVVWKWQKKWRRSFQCGLHCPSRDPPTGGVVHRTERKRTRFGCLAGRRRSEEPVRKDGSYDGARTLRQPTAVPLQSTNELPREFTRRTTSRPQLGGVGTKGKASQQLQLLADGCLDAEEDDESSPDEGVMDPWGWTCSACGG